MAYVEFETKEALEAAYAKKGSLQINGRKVQVSLLGVTPTAPEKSNDPPPSKDNHSEEVASNKTKPKSIKPKNKPKFSKKPKKGK